MTICSSHGIKTQEIKGKLSITTLPLEDFNWLIDIFATMTDNTDTYDFVFYEDSETLPGHLKASAKK